MDTFILDTFELQHNFSLGQNNLYVISSEEVFACDLILCGFFFSWPQEMKKEVFSVKKLNFGIFFSPKVPSRKLEK